MNPNEFPSMEPQLTPSEKGKMPLQTGRPKAPGRIFPPRRDYASVSIKDLLDAREASPTTPGAWFGTALSLTRSRVHRL
jgi:hypothetical protein